MQRPEGDRYLMTQSELESRIQVLLAGTVAEEMIFGDVSTGAQNDLERATEIARSMVMDFGMSRLGRVNYRESRRCAVPGRRRTNCPASAATASRRPAKSTRRSSGSSTSRWRRCGTSWKPARPALVALAERLIEKEVIDTDELKQIIEANSPSPMIVPGTAVGPPAFYARGQRAAQRRLGSGRERLTTASRMDCR